MVAGDRPDRVKEVFQEVRPLKVAKERAPAAVFGKEKANWLEFYTRQYRANPGPGKYDSTTSQFNLPMVKIGNRMDSRSPQWLQHHQHTPRYSIQHKKPMKTPPWHNTPGPGEYAVYEGFFSPRPPVYREPFSSVARATGESGGTKSGKSGTGGSKSF